MGECISVQSGSQLAVKVEGVIQHGQRPGLFRKVEGVVVSVNSVLQTSNKSKDLDMKVELCLVCCSSTTRCVFEFSNGKFPECRN